MQRRSSRFNMRSSFNLILWGLVFAFFDLTLTGFDFLPDVVGYLLFSLGAGRLAFQSFSFRVASSASMFALLVSLALGVSPPDLAQALALGSTLLEFLMVWFLLGGILEAARKHDRPRLARLTSKRRAQFVFWVLLAFFLFLVLARVQDASVLLLPVALASLAVMVMVFIHISHARDELAPRRERRTSLVQSAVLTARARRRPRAARPRTRQRWS